MKKNFFKFSLLVVALLFFTVVMHKQSNAQMVVGVRTGYLSSAFYNNSMSKISDNKTGFAAGAFFQYGISDILGIDFGVSYAGKGGRDLNPEYLYHIENQYADNMIVNTNVKLNNLEIPLLINLYPAGSASNIVPKIFVGAAYDYSFYSKSQNFYAKNYSNGTLVTNETVNLGTRLLKHDFTAFLGGGIDYKLGQYTVGLDLRYNFGLRNINNVESQFNNSNFQNNTFAIMASFGFNL